MSGTVADRADHTINPLEHFIPLLEDYVAEIGRRPTRLGRLLFELIRRTRGRRYELIEPSAISLTYKLS